MIRKIEVQKDQEINDVKTQLDNEKARNLKIQAT